MNTGIRLTVSRSLVVCLVACLVTSSVQASFWSSLWSNPRKVLIGALSVGIAGLVLWKTYKKDPSSSSSPNRSLTSASQTGATTSSTTVPSLPVGTNSDVGSSNALSPSRSPFVSKHKSPEEVREQLIRGKREHQLPNKMTQYWLRWPKVPSEADRKHIAANTTQTDDALCVVPNRQLAIEQTAGSGFVSEIDNKQRRVKSNQRNQAGRAFAHHFGVLQKNSDEQGALLEHLQRLKQDLPEDE